MPASLSQLLVGGGRVSTDTSGRPSNGKEGLQKELRLPSGKNIANMIYLLKENHITLLSFDKMFL